MSSQVIIHFPFVSEIKVLKCLSRLGAKKTTCFDNNPARLVRDSAFIIDILLRYVITKIVPNESKKDGKDQESIQSSTTSDPGYHVRK